MMRLRYVAELLVSVALIFLLVLMLWPSELAYLTPNYTDSVEDQRMEELTKKWQTTLKSESLFGLNFESENQREPASVEEIEIIEPTLIPAPLPPVDNRTAEPTPAPAPPEDYETAEPMPAPAPPEDHEIVDPFSAPPPPEDDVTEESIPARPTGEADNSVDRALASLNKVSMGFSAPKTVGIKDTAVVHLVLSPLEALDTVLSSLQQDEQLFGREVRASNRMIARLSGSKFDIKAVADEEQAVSVNERTEWQWEITPKAAGNNKLFLSLSAVIDVEGEEMPRTLGTYSKEIFVESPLIENINEWLNPYYAFVGIITSFVTAGYVTIVFVRKRYRRRRINPNQPVG